MTEPFHSRGGRVYYVELWAPLEVRLRRNQDPERAAWKKTDWATEEYVRQHEASGVRDSHGKLPLDLPFMRMETAEMSITDCAEPIAAHIGALGAAYPSKGRDVKNASDDDSHVRTHPS